jgi:LPS sulfotransferase NodH
MRGYVICTTPRTGSNLLSDVLVQSGAGLPDEWLDETYLHARLVDAAAAAAASTPSHPRCADPSRYLDVLFQRTATTTFGIKVHRHQLEAAPDLGLGRPLDALARRCDPLVLVHLRRRDEIAQAVSGHLASTSGRYFDLGPDATPPTPGDHWAGPGALGGARTTTAVPYDRAAIDERRARIRRAEAAWLRDLAVVGGPHLTIEYETLARDPVGAARPLLDLLGLAPPTRFRPTFRRQAGPINEEMAGRYRAGG